MEWWRNSKDVWLQVRDSGVEMQKCLIAMCIALVSLMIAAPPIRAGVQTTACKPGNLYKEGPARGVVITNFLLRLKGAIKDGDKSKVSDFIHYPLSVATAHKSFAVGSAKGFVANYERILPASLRNFILAQQPQCVSRVGVQGFSIGNGQIWFDQFPDGKVRIFSVNAVVYSN